MAIKLKKTIALLLAAVTLFTLVDRHMPLSVYAATQSNINGHSLIAENNAYALYMNEEYLSVIVLDKATGAYMESAVSYDDGKNNDMWLGAMHSALVLQMGTFHANGKGKGLVKLS